MIVKRSTLEFKKELEPTNGRVSFYHKAKVYIDKKGNEFLKSYDTFVCYKDKHGMIHRIWDGWTNTTGNHIKSFCGLNKKEFTRLDFGKDNNDYVVY